MNIVSGIKSMIGGTSGEIIYHPLILIPGSLILAAMIYGSFIILDRKDIKPDKKFLTYISPLIIAGGLIEPFFTVFHSFLFIGSSFLVYTVLEHFRKSKNPGFDPKKVFFIAGTLLLIYIISLFDPVFSEAVKTSLIISMSWIGLLGALNLKNILPSGLFFPIFGQMADASSTYSVLRAGGSEKIFFADFFVDQLGIGGIFVFKAVTVIPISAYIYLNLQEDEASYYLYIIGILGLTLGIRNLLVA